MAAKIWKTSGTIQYVSLTNDRLPEVLDLFATAYMPDEPISVASETFKCPQEIKETLGYVKELANEGCSVVAIDTNSNKVVGLAINSLDDAESSKKMLEEINEFYKEPQTTASKSVLEFVMDIASSFDILDSCNVDCSFQLSFLVTSPKYRGKAISKTLCEVSIEMAKCLLAGEKVKTPLTSEELPLEPVPKVVYGIFTSFITQRIASSLGFVPLVTKNYADLKITDQSFFARVPTHTKCIIVSYKKL